MTSGNVYVGVLIKAYEVQLVVGRTVRDSVVSLHTPLPRFASYKGGQFDRRHPITRDTREAVLTAIGQHIASIPDEVRRVGVGTYGPIESVSLEDRDAMQSERFEKQDALKRNARYGKVRNTSTHEALRELSVYHTLREALERHERPPEVFVQSDVMVGAVAEATGRSMKRTGVRLHGPNDVLVFLHIAEGIGGAFVVGTEPWRSALHPEMGYQAVSLVEGDVWAQRLTKERARTDRPVFVQDVASLQALRERWESKRSARDADNGWSPALVAKSDWKLVLEYVTQLCASAVVMLAPHQIVLHGPVVHSAPFDFVKAVEEQLPKWLRVGKRGSIVSYEEMVDDKCAFVDRPLDLGLEPGKPGEPKYEPMLKGALILAAQPDYRRRPDSDAEIKEFKARPRA